MPFFQCLQAFLLSTPALLGALEIFLLQTVSTKSQRCSQQMCTYLRSRLWILCRTKDREENPHLQLNYPLMAAMCQGHRSRKTGRNRINLIPPISPSPFLPKRWRNTAEHSKAHRKVTDISNSLPEHSRHYIHKCLFLCCTKKYMLKNEGNSFKGSQEKLIAEPRQNSLLHSNQPHNKIFTKLLWFK